MSPEAEAWWHFLGRNMAFYSVVGIVLHETLDPGPLRSLLLLALLAGAVILAVTGVVNAVEAYERTKHTRDPFVEWIHRPLDPIDAVDEKWISKPVLDEVLSEEGQDYLRLVRRNYLKHPTNAENLEREIENLLAGRLPWEDQCGTPTVTPS